MLMFLLLLTYIGYSLITQFRLSGVEVKHHIARYEAEKNLWNEKTHAAFSSLQKKSTPKPSSETAEKKVTFHPRRSTAILQPHSLLPLLENSTPQELSHAIDALFLFFYAPVTIEGKPVSQKYLLSEFHALLARAKSQKMSGEDPTWDTLLRDTPFETKVKEGTKRVSWTPRKGYPPIHTVFSFEEAPSPLVFSGLPESALLCLFSQNETALILQREQELNNGYPLSIQELEALLPGHSICPFLHSKKGKKGKRTAHDEHFIVEITAP